MISHDNSNRLGHAAFAPAGTGLPASRNCMPGNHHVLNQVGGGSYKYRGVPNVWHCASCKAVRAERMKARAA
jgi:hypothetical protein